MALFKGWLAGSGRVCALSTYYTCVLTCDHVRGADDLVKLQHTLRFSFIPSRYQYNPRGTTPLPLPSKLI